MRYAAFLRGIGPSNPNMANDKLRAAVESAGYTEVASVLSSGNLVFSSPETDRAAHEARIEAALTDRLGLDVATIVRSAPELEDLIERDPFAGLEHGRETYLTVTFLKDRPDDIDLAVPYENDEGTFRVLSYDRDVHGVCAVTDNTSPKTPEIMVWLERQFSRRITTRTWLTVQRVAREF